MSTGVTLGEKYRDEITGFVGTAIARVEYLNGCIRIELEGKVDKDGKPQESVFVDEQRLVHVGTRRRVASAAPVGGSRPRPAAFGRKR